MASSFLKKKAEEQAKRIDEKYGASAYGGSSSLASSGKKSNTTESKSKDTSEKKEKKDSNKPVTRASSFLTQKAKAQAERIDKEYGGDAYGGTKSLLLDKEAGVKNWLNELNSFSKRMGDDYSQREGKYQNAKEFGRYKTDTQATAGAMQNQADAYRLYFDANRDIYGDETVDSILKSIDEGKNYLSGVHESVGGEYDYWSQWESEDEYNEYNRLTALDLNAAQKQLEELQAQMEKAKKDRDLLLSTMGRTDRYGTPEVLERNSKALAEKEAIYKELNEQVAALNRDIYNATHYQDSAKYYSYMDAEDFDQYASTDTPAIRDIEYLKEDELRIYNYLMAKEGWPAARDYMEHLQEAINYRKGTERGKDIRGIDSDIGRLLATGTHSLWSGISGFGHNVEGLFMDEVQPTSADQYAYDYIYNDLGKVGEKNKWATLDSEANPDGTTWAQMAYGAGNTIGNMVPSIAIAALTKGVVNPLVSSAATAGKISAGVGSAALGVGAAGGAYQEKLKEGYTKEQARSYGIAVGVSEAALSYALSGIGSLASPGGVSETLLAKANAIRNGAARAFAAGGIKIGSEWIEEELQLWLEPLYATLLLGEEYDAPTAEERAYTAILTALTTGIIEAPDIISFARNKPNSFNQTVQEPSAPPETLEQAALEATGTYTRDDYEQAQTSVAAAESALSEARQNGADQATISTLESNVRAAQEKVGYIGAEKPTAQPVSEVRRTADTTEGASRNAVREAVNSPVEELGYGEHGRKALTSIVESGAMSVEQANTEFHLPYLQGLSNMEVSETSFSSPIQQEAFNAGKLDRIAGLNKDINNSQFATSYGKESGLIKNDLVKKFKKQDVARLNKASKVFGTKTIIAQEIWQKDGVIVPKGTEGAREADAAMRDDGVLVISANAGDPLFTLMKHEFTHRFQQLAPTEYRAYRDAVMSYVVSADISLGGKTSTVSSYQNTLGYDVEYSADEIAADFSEYIMRDPKEFDRFVDSLLNPEKNTEEQVKKNRTTLQRFMDAIHDFLEKVRKIFKGDTEKMDAAAQESFGATVAALEEIERRWKDAAKASVERVREMGDGVTTVRDGKLFRTTEADGTVVLETSVGNPVAMMDKNGSAQFSMKTYKAFGRSELKRWLDLRVSKNQLSQADAADIVKQLDEYYDLCQKFLDKYAPFGAWSNAEVVRDNKGKPVFSVVKANGEYAMNLDFSLVCKKRRTLDAVFKEMINRGIMDNLSLEEADIAKVNEIIRESGFETACALCFVDSKRYRQAKVADTFVTQYNDILRQMLPEDGSARAHHFDFVGSGVYKDPGVGLHTLSNAQLQPGIEKLKQIMRENGSKTVAHKIAKHLLNNPADRKLMSRSDFMNTDGFGAVKLKNPAVLKLYNASKGAGGPKASFSDVQYLGEILQKNNFTPARAYAVGGVRIQSFSDYIPRLVFDYMQMVADLAAKKLPAHAYTKEAIFVKQFGMTGIKMNMSLVPAVAEDGVAVGLDKNGDYFWFDGQSFGSDVKIKGSGKTGYELAVKIQNTPGYSQHCGTIAVGVSYEHIMKMLGDENIRMIIPYHKSSLNHIVAVMNNIDKYTDYTKVQNTRNADGTKITGKDFNFNEALQRTGDAKAAANEYLAWCKERNYIPKFDDFAGHENYYKVLEDFATYDNGVAAPQGAVTMTLPKKGDAFGSMAELIEEGLEEDALLEASREKSVPEIVDKVEKALQKKVDSGNSEAYNDGIKARMKMKEGAGNGRETEVSGRLESDSQLHAAGFAGGRSGKTAGGGVQAQVRYRSLTEYEKDRLTEILIPAVDKNPFWRSVVLEMSTRQAAEKIYDGIVQNTSVIERMKEQIPGFEKAAQQAVEFVNRKNTSASVGQNDASNNEPAIKADSKGRRLTDAQREFFRDAQTVDQDGNLLVLYHGSRSEAFTEFDLYEGVWLTPDQRYAEVYAEQWHSWRDDVAEFGDRRSDLNGLEPEIYADPDYRIYEMYANITEPVDLGELDDWLSDGKVRAIARALGVRYSELKQIADDYMEERTYMLTRSHEFIEFVRNLKRFDGFKATESSKETWCAFAAQDQVKLTTNKNPTKKPDVRFSMKGQQKLLRDVSEEQAVNGDVGVRFSMRKTDPPKKTELVYKLMRLKDGKIYPLFIDSTEALEKGVWYDADSPNLDFLKKLPSGIFLVDAESESYVTYDEYLAESGEKKTKYPSKKAIEQAAAEGKRWVFIEDAVNKKGEPAKQKRFDGETRRYWNLGINGTGSVSTFSMRPGYHAGSLPTMRQIGKGANRDLRDDTFVWTVGRVPADIDYQAEADRNPDKDIPTHIPVDGYYLKATNADKAKSQADVMGWYVAGSYIIDRIIGDAEARSIIDQWNAEHPDAQAMYDYERESGMEFDAEQMKLVPKGTARFSTKGQRDNQKGQPDILKDLDALRDEVDRIREEGEKSGKSARDIQREVMRVVGPAYGALLKTYGEIERGEKPYREIKVPKRTSEDKKVSQTVRTILEARATPNSAVPKIQEMIVSGDFSYDVYTDEEAINTAEGIISNKGYAVALAEWIKDVEAGKVNKTNTALGWALYNAAAAEEDMATAMTILNHMVGHQRNAAQAVQATRILKKLEPDAQLYGVVRSVQQMEDDLNEGKKLDQAGAKRAADSVGRAKKDAADAVGKAFGDVKVKRKGNRVTIDSNMVGEPFVFEYAQKVGEALAKSLEAKRNRTKKEVTFLQQITAQLKKFAAEKMPKEQKEKQLTAVDLLRDYIQNQSFYADAWAYAQEELREKYAGDPMFDEFVNTGIGVDANANPVNALFMRAMVMAAADSGEGASVLRKQAALGFTGMADTIADNLIQQTEASGEMADTIRDAVYAYVYSKLNEEGKADTSIVDAAIRSAMSDIGIKVSEVVKSGTEATAKQAIIDKLVGKYGFGSAEATNTADIVAEHFQQMCRDYSQRTLENMFKERKVNQKSIPEKIEMLARLGAFDVGSAYNQKAAERIFKEGVTLTVNEDLAQKFLLAKTQEERDNILADLYRDIGRQIPSSFMDKWNAWRYLAMLGNPRTHVRNVVGNLGFAPVVAVKDLAATIIEATVDFVSGGKMNRTKAGISPKLLKAAWADYNNVAAEITAGGKYSDAAIKNQHIEEGRRIYKFKPLEWARKGNSAAMEAEDMWFARPHYAFALAQYCKANGVTEDQLRRGKTLGNARAYAIKEAQKATYRDTNAFSEAISKIGRYHGDNPVMKGISVVTEGILPFRKTPANILVRGIEYSPVGLLKGLTYDLYKVAKGDMMAAEAIDHVAAGLTGSGLLALGVYLAAEGLIRGSGGGDDEEKKFEEMQGHQAYALELPDGTSVTLDWLAPEVLPLFIGVNLHEMAIENKGQTNLSDMLTAISNVTEPLLEMSCLQSLNDIFDSVGYASSNGLDALPSALASAATSYLTQAFPTIFGQAERSAQDERMTTYTENSDFLTSDMQYTIGKVSAKIPGWDYNQIPYIDAWGRTESTGSQWENIANNFLNPAYMSQIETSAMEDELLRLYDLTGEASVLPDRPRKYFNVDAERKDLTAEEYVQYATERGQTSHEMLTELTALPEYRKMSDSEKVDAVEMVYEYADAVAKMSISDYDPDGWVDKVLDKKLGMDAIDYILYDAALSMVDKPNKNGELGGTPTSEEKAAAIELRKDLSDSQIAYLWDTKDGYAAYEGGVDMRGYVNQIAAGASINVEKLIGAKDYGMSDEEYYDFLGALDKFDQPTESGTYGTFTQDEAAAAIASLPDLSREQRAYLWQSVNKGWKAKNNPWG